MAGGGYSELILASNPVAYYRMGDSSETTVLDDSSGNGRIGSRFGATTGAASLIPNDPENAAMSFDGSNDWCEINALQGISDEFAAAGITVEFWCAYSAPHETYAVLALNSTSIANVVHFNVAETPRVFLNGESYDGSIVTDDGAPHHVAITYTPGGQIHLFVDGVEDTAGEFPVTGEDIPFNAISTTWSIGQEFDGSNTSNHYEGVLDELAIYVGPRSPATLLEHYQKGMTPASVERSHVAGSTEIDGVGYSRDVIVITDTPFGRQVLAEGKSQGNGEFDIEYEEWGGPVLVIAVDSYGVEFEVDTVLSVGSRVHPVTPNGYVYDVTVAGTTGSSEPVWPTGGSVVSGSVTFQALPFYRPVGSGPLQGEPVA